MEVVKIDAHAEARHTPRTLLTLGEVAARIGVSRPRLWVIRKDPAFPRPVFLGKSPRFRVSEIEVWEASLPREPRDAAA